MKLVAQGIIINGITHILFSPQKGTECGIGNINKENIIDLQDTTDITCKACKGITIERFNILASMQCK